MAYTLPFELYQQIEQQLGKELATQVAKTIKNGVASVEQQAGNIAVQKKIGTQIGT